VVYVCGSSQLVQLLRDEVQGGKWGEREEEEKGGRTAWQQEMELGM